MTGPASPAGGETRNVRIPQWTWGMLALLGILILLQRSGKLPLSLSWQLGIVVVVLVISFGVDSLRQTLGGALGTVVGALRAERQQEPTESRQRFERFQAVHRFMLRVPLLGWLVRWTVTEGWPGVGLLLALVLGCVLRLYGAGEVRFSDDEYILLYDVRQFMEGAPIAALRERGLWLSTMPAIWSSQLFGASAFALRLPGIVLNALGAVPLYLLLRRVHRPIAACAALLWAVNPWMVGISRNLREYAVFPLFYAWTGALWANILAFVRDAFGPSVRRTGGRFLGMAWRGALLIAPLWYAYVVDPLSTFRSIAPLYGAGLVLLAYLLLRRTAVFRERQGSLAVIIGVTVCVAAIVLTVIRNGGTFATLRLLWIPLFFGNAPQQVFFERSLMTVYLGIAVTLIAARLVRSLTVWFVLTSVGVYLFTYVVVFGRYFRPRYAIVMQVWVIALTAIALYLVYRLLAVLLRRRWLSGLAVVALTVNLSQVVLPSVQFRSGYFPVTDEYHYDTDAAFAYVHERLQPDDVLITTSNLTAGLYVQYGTTHERTVAYDYFTSGRTQIATQILRARRGWVLLDVLRNGKWLEGLPHEDFSVDGTLVHYIGLLGDIHVYTWGTD